MVSGGGIDLHVYPGEGAEAPRATRRRLGRTNADWISAMRSQMVAPVEARAVLIINNKRN